MRFASATMLILYLQIIVHSQCPKDVLEFVGVLYLSKAAHIPAICY